MIFSKLENILRSAAQSNPIIQECSEPLFNDQRDISTMVHLLEEA